MKTLEITKDAAIKAYKNSSQESKNLLEDLFGKEIFQKKPIERIKTVEDILGEYNISIEQFNLANKDLSKDEKAYKILKMLANILNEGWEPNWDNNNEYKYFPYFNMSSSGFRVDGCDHWATFSSVCSRLCFKSSELAKYAGTQFEDIYKDLFIF